MYKYDINDERSSPVALSRPLTRLDGPPSISI